MGINPVLYGKDPGIFIRGGFGLHKKADLALKYGFFEGDNYLGADLKWEARKTERISISLFSGVHMKGALGIDLGGIISFPAGVHADIFSGVDIDVVFAGKTEHFTWIPVGAEIRFNRNTSLILEADVPMSHFAWNIFGGGLKYYF